MIRELVDEDGENRAVRSFLMQYSCDRSITVAAMKQHMGLSGWEGCWPSWANNYDERMHLTKGGAQNWIRHLFEMEATAPAQEAAPMSEIRNISKVKRNSDFSVELVFLSCRAASEFERSILGSAKQEGEAG